MASWNTPASSWKKTTFSRKKTTNLNASFRDLPWEDLAESCQSEIDTAIATAEDNFNLAYEKFIEGKEREWQSLNPESGPFEGDWEAEYPRGPLPDTHNIKRAAADAAVVSFIERHFIKAQAMVLLPQIMEYIATFKLSTADGDEWDPKVDKPISAARLYRAYFMNDGFNRGLYHFLMLEKRSAYLDTQYKAPARNYCALVPLIPYAFKLKHGVPYKAWDEDGIKGVVSPSLAEAMTFDVDPPFTTEELLLARSTGLRVKSGANEGDMRNPLYTYKLFGAEGMKGVPGLVQTMYTQIWCAHPSNRTKYMVLDPVNWDTMPAPLVTSEVMAGTKTSEYDFTAKSKDEVVDTPW